MSLFTNASESVLVPKGAMIFLFSSFLSLLISRQHRSNALEDIDIRYDDYFSALNDALKSHEDCQGASHAILDIERYDFNVAEIQRLVHPSLSIRIVTKSLPSMKLLEYTMDKLATKKLMVFSEPMMLEILNAMDHSGINSLDVLLGKPLPVEAFSRLMSVTNTFSSITWLIDSRERLLEYLEVAKRESRIINIAFEIDVGLHRGGFINPDEMACVIIDVLLPNKSIVCLRGLMGYDGHVPFALSLPVLRPIEHALRQSFTLTHRRYSDFVSVLREHFSSGEIASMIFNSGGSHTLHRYSRDNVLHSPVNEIGIGSAFLAPTQFPECTNQGLKPALFLAAPILKQIDHALLPHAEIITSLLVNWWDRNLKVSYFMLGGGWPGEVVAPKGLIRNYFWDGESGRLFGNMLPNQSILSSARTKGLRRGDFVFSQAWEGDGMLAFRCLRLFSASKFAVCESWDCYRGGN